MGKPDWVNDNKVWVWNNALTILFNVLLSSIFPVLCIVSFIRSPKSYGFLIAAIIPWYLIYELGVYTYIRVVYQNGVLEFRKPLRKYSLLFRKKDQKILIYPDEWTEVYRRSYKGSTSYYFRNNQTAAYFVKADGLNFLYSDLDVLFPQRVRMLQEFPGEIRRRLKKEFPERVF